MAKDKDKKLESIRKVIPLQTKIEILNCLHNNEKIIDVANFYSMNEAIIGTIKNKILIRKSVAAGMFTSLTTIFHCRNVAMENMKIKKEFDKKIRP